MTSRKRSSKKKTSPQSSSGNPCTNEEIVPKEEFEVEQEAYWDALCGSITPSPESPERGCVSSPGGWGECGGSSEGFFTCYEAFLTRCRMWFPIPEAIVCALDHFVLSTSQLNVAALQNFLGVLIQSYELRMDLSPDDFEGLWGILQMPRDGSSVFSMFELMAHPSRITVPPCSVANGTFIVRTISSPRPPGTCLLSAIFSATVRSFGIHSP
ncbi:hypothetical protein F2Q68_00004407 [Brassica cretica]|uniref:Peptidase C31 domain-containing protein n=1 Tax=Brassica cretica TaxID=69181 RepID=A0A8S9J9G9_BRACR|nr:hypothetical protein F2Q68_00004407 [Brassica cretica]